MPEFKGLKVCWSGNGLSGYPDIRRIEIAKEKGEYVNTFVFKPGTVGGGGNSGFQALNLALQFGARRILLIGFDMQREAPGHWYGRNNWPSAANPDDRNFRRWIAALNTAAALEIGADIVNTSPKSAVTAFRKASIDEALDEWGLT